MTFEGFLRERRIGTITGYASCGTLAARALETTLLGEGMHGWPRQRIDTTVASLAKQGAKLGIEVHEDAKGGASAVFDDMVVSFTRHQGLFESAECRALRWSNDGARDVAAARRAAIATDLGLETGARTVQVGGDLVTLTGGGAGYRILEETVADCAAMLRNGRRVDGSGATARAILRTATPDAQASFGTLEGDDDDATIAFEDIDLERAVGQCARWIANALAPCAHGLVGAEIVHEVGATPSSASLAAAATLEAGRARARLAARLQATQAPDKLRRLVDGTRPEKTAAKRQSP